VNQWEIYDYPYAEEGSHPVLIISNPARAGNRHFVEVNGLFCQTARPQVPLKAFHFLLAQADGLDNPTLVRCDHIRALRREFVGQRRGVVSRSRRLALFRKVLECYSCPP
jgi:mRNA-degrading endonuclease toxin of MazEF toxin-antitoxin module